MILRAWHGCLLPKDMTLLPSSVVIKKRINGIMLEEAKSLFAHQSDMILG